MANIDHDKINSLVKAYFAQSKYKNFNNPTQLDMLIVDAVGDWINGKIDDLTLVHVCKELESEPMHHNMHNNWPVYAGIKLDYYIMKDDAVALKEMQDELKDWYNSL